MLHLGRPKCKQMKKGKKSVELTQVGDSESIREAGCRIYSRINPNQSAMTEVWDTGELYIREYEDRYN